MYGVIIDIPMYFSGFFHVKPTLRWVLDTQKFECHFFGSIPTIKYYRTLMIKEHCHKCATLFRL